jgi:tetratricopeptide (TPR) repeat protein
LSEAASPPAPTAAAAAAAANTSLVIPVPLSLATGSTVKVAAADDGYADVSDHGNGNKPIEVPPTLIERAGRATLSSGLYKGYEGYSIDKSARPKANARSEDDDEDDDDDDDDEAAAAAHAAPSKPARIDPGAYDTHSTPPVEGAAANGHDDARRIHSMPLVEPTMAHDSEASQLFTAEDCARVETLALSELHARLARLAGRQPQMVAAAVSLMARGDATLLESVHRAIDRVALLAVGGDVGRAMTLTGGVVPFRSHVDPPLWKLHVQRAWSREWRTLSEALQRSRRRRRRVRDDDDDDDDDDEDEDDHDAEPADSGAVASVDDDVVKTSLSPLGASIEGLDARDVSEKRAIASAEANARSGAVSNGVGGDASSGAEPARAVNSLDTLVRLRNLANDFVSVAEQYGRIIISERHLPNIDKTIRPVGVGGVAGGDKYIAQGILFKFAVDTKISDTLWMYGGKTSSDENATRVAGNELRGLISYYKCGVRNLAVPLMALIDYRGYRLVACSLLPIGADTLRYGSDDGGQTVHNDDPVLANKMRRVARQLHLKGHVVGRRPLPAGDASSATSPASTRMLHGPGDIEGHLGRDGQYWVLDFARVFPPEAPDAMQFQDDPAAPVDRSRRIFSDLLRPELVRRHPVALSSDAFSNFQAADRRASQLNAQVRAATRDLHERAIPEYADSLPVDPSWSVIGPTPVVEGLHSRGISVRHLGLVRSHLPRGDEGRLRRRLCLTEMCHRMVKNQLRQQLRVAAERCRLPSLELDRRVLLDVLNVVFALKASSMQFWTVSSGSIPIEATIGGGGLVPAKRALLDKFGRHALEAAELPASFDLRREIDAALLIERLQVSMRIRLSDRTVAELTQSRGHNDWPVRDASFELVDRDLLSISPKVKHMNVVGFTTAVVLRLEAERQRSAPEFERLFTMAEQTFKATLASLPDDANTWLEWGKLLHERARRTAQLTNYEQALAKFERARQNSDALADPALLADMGRCQIDYAAAVLDESLNLRANAQKMADITLEAERSGQLHAAEVSSISLRLFGGGASTGRRMAGPSINKLTETPGSLAHRQRQSVNAAVMTTVAEMERTARRNLAAALYSAASLSGRVLREARRLYAGCALPYSIGGVANSDTPSNGERERAAGDASDDSDDTSDTQSATASRDEDVSNDNSDATATAEDDGDAPSATAAPSAAATSAEKKPTSMELVTAEGTLAACITMLQSIVDGEPPETGGNALGLAPELSVTVAPARRPPQVPLRHAVEARRLLTRALVRWAALLMSRADLSQHQDRHDFGVDPLMRAAAKLREAQHYADGGRRPDPEARQWLNAELERMSNRADDTTFVKLCCLRLHAPLLLGTHIEERCRHLRQLDLCGMSGVPASALVLIIRQCPRLRRLSLLGCWQVDSSLLRLMALDGPERLRMLNLSGCHEIEDSSVASLAQGMPMRGLRHLALARCDRITDAGMLPIVSMMRLHSLDVSSARFAPTRGITDVTITKLAHVSGALLRSLLLNGCEGVTDASLAELGKCCPQLSVLEIEHFNVMRAEGSGASGGGNSPATPSRARITEKGVLALLKQATRLRYVNARGLGLNGKSVDQRLARSNPKCEVLLEDGVHRVVTPANNAAKSKRRSLNLTGVVSLRASQAIELNVSTGTSSGDDQQQQPQVQQQPTE